MNISLKIPPKSVLFTTLWDGILEKLLGRTPPKPIPNYTRCRPRPFVKWCRRHHLSRASVHGKIETSRNEKTNVYGRPACVEGQKLRRACLAEHKTLTMAVSLSPHREILAISVAPPCPPWSWVSIWRILDAGMVTVRYCNALCTGTSMLWCWIAVEFVLVSTERHESADTKIVVLRA